MQQFPKIKKVLCIVHSRGSACLAKKFKVLDCVGSPNYINHKMIRDTSSTKFVNLRPFTVLWLIDCVEDADVKEVLRH